MSKKYVLATLVILGFSIVGYLFWFMVTSDAAVLSPKGHIAERQTEILIFASVLSLFVIVPVYVLLFAIAFRYREGNKRAKYTPNWDHNRLAESVWWGIPITIILILSVVTWKTTHELDPFKPIQAEASPLRIQAVALQWKWLFIYPEQNIATLNYVQIPENVPVQFELTSDAPMNSFWIPELGGQIYAMAGMDSRLHLMANQTGHFRGMSANISGEGFADMNFEVVSSDLESFNSWLESTKQSPDTLDESTYVSVAKPQRAAPKAFYRLAEPDLYQKILSKYGHSHGADSNEGEAKEIFSSDHNDHQEHMYEIKD